MNVESTGRVTLWMLFVDRLFVSALSSSILTGLIYP